MTNINYILSKIDRSSFKKIVFEKDTYKHQKGYSSWIHLISMLFCQFAKSQSVRDISNGLRSATGNLKVHVVQMTLLLLLQKQEVSRQKVNFE